MTPNEIAARLQADGLTPAAGYTLTTDAVGVTVTRARPYPAVRFEWNAHWGMIGYWKLDHPRARRACWYTWSARPEARETLGRMWESSIEAAQRILYGAAAAAGA